MKKYYYILKRLYKRFFITMGIELYRYRIRLGTHTPIFFSKKSSQDRCCSSSKNIALCCKSARCIQSAKFHVSHSYYYGFSTGRPRYVIRWKQRILAACAVLIRKFLESILCYLSPYNILQHKLYTYCGIYNTRKNVL